jgi:hypothetical protein
MSGVTDKARDFLARNGRLLERRLFAFHFDGGSADAVVSALAAYQNADGGFGWGLEPDKRAAASQPVDLQIALQTLDAVGRVRGPLTEAALGWLDATSDEGGALPYTLPSSANAPHAFWWEPNDERCAPNLNPTAAIIGLLAKHGLVHRAINRGAAFCWTALEGSETTDFHEIMPTLEFLASAQDRGRAEAAVDRIRGRVGAPGVVALDPDATGYVQKPLDFAPTPASPLHTLFGQPVLDHHLDALAARQQDDGGWPLNWESVGPGATLEARGMVTLQALLTLRAYDRLA